VEPRTLWLAVGFAGQALFFSRFLVQWLASEKRRESYLPRAFWFLSIGGGLTLLAYAIHRRDPVFIVGQATGILIYGRNLWFIYGPTGGRKADGKPGGDD
jgi:lipid-A-disaccharide synthase-like uncharacterized protein